VLAALLLPSLPAMTVALLAQEPLYGYYTAVPRLRGLSAMDDQRAGWALMALWEGLTFLAAFGVLFHRMVDASVKHAGLAAVTLLVFAAVTAGLGGASHRGRDRVRLVQAGPWVLSAWTRPDPPTLEGFSVSVAVMRPDDRSPVLDATVRLVVAPEDRGEPPRVVEVGLGWRAGRGRGIARAGAALPDAGAPSAGGRA
jgi:hypothetical protein